MGRWQGWRVELRELGKVVAGFLVVLAITYMIVTCGNMHPDAKSGHVPNYRD